MPSKRRKREKKIPQNEKSGESNSQGSDEESDNEKFEIDFIVDHKITKSSKSIKFQVRWKKYGADDDTWEPFEMFAYDAPEAAKKYIIQMIQQFEKKNKQATKEEEKQPADSKPIKGTQELAEQHESLDKRHIRIISQFEFGEDQTIGFLIETIDNDTQQLQRELISEEELLKTHSVEMYMFLKSSLKFDKKVLIKKSEIMKPDFETFLETFHQSKEIQTSDINAQNATESKQLRSRNVPKQ